MQFIDTHTHLYSSKFKEDRIQVIEKAINAGVSKLFLPNIDSSSTEGMKELVKRFPENCFSMAGLHPCSVDEKVEEELNQVEQLLSSEKNIAVGEIGIDLYWDKTFLKEQQYAFRKQINWAKERELPIVIHCREAFDEILSIMDDMNDEKMRGVFHCFTGNLEQARHIINYGGFKLGIGGVVTFKNAGLDKVVKNIDLEHLVLETDSPYLAPMPYRGKRNESAYIVNIAEKLSDIYELPLKEVADKTTKNALEVFTIK